MKVCRTLRHTAFFDTSLLAFGSTVEADDAIGCLLGKIASAGDLFPVVQVPEVRLATEAGCAVAVFFRLKGTQEVELLRVLVLQDPGILAA